MKVAPDPDPALGPGASGTNSCDDSFDKSKKKRGTQRADAKVSTRGGIALASVRGETGWKRDPVIVPTGSGRGHDLDGGGLTVGQGHLAQAKDRNFEGVFQRCREAIDTIRATAKSASCCQDAFKELDDAVYHVRCMLVHLEAIFTHEKTRTIVSLKQLCVQLELSREEALVFEHLPALSCTERLCGGASRLAELEHEGIEDLRKQTKATLAYATAFLIEHGFRSSDLREFASRSMTGLAPAPAPATAQYPVLTAMKSLQGAMMQEELRDSHDGSHMGIIA